MLVLSYLIENFCVFLTVCLHLCCHISFRAFVCYSLSAYISAVISHSQFLCVTHGVFTLVLSYLIENFCVFLTVCLHLCCHISFRAFVCYSLSAYISAVISHSQFLCVTHGVFTLVLSYLIQSFCVLLMVCLH